jgi:hypothetical protein
MQVERKLKKTRVIGFIGQKTLKEYFNGSLHGTKYLKKQQREVIITVSKRIMLGLLVLSLSHQKELRRKSEIKRCLNKATIWSLRALLMSS